MLVSHDQSYVTVVLADYETPISGFEIEFRSSLRSTDEGAATWEMKYEKMILNVFDAMYPGKTIVIGDRLRPGKVRILPYDGEPYDSELQIPIERMRIGTVDLKDGAFGVEEGSLRERVAMEEDVHRILHG